MDMEAQMKHYLSQINNIAERQNLIISNLLESKNRIIDQTNINAYELMQTNLKDRIMIETSSSTYNMDNNRMLSNLLESKNRIIDQTNINAYELMQTNLKDRIMIETSSSTYNMDNNRMLSDSNRREVPLLEDK